MKSRHARPEPQHTTSTKLVLQYIPWKYSIDIASTNVLYKPFSLPVAIALMSTATIYNKDSKWVIERLRQIGFDAERKDPTAVAMFREVLDKKEVDDGKDDGKDGASGIWGYQQQMWTMFSLVVVHMLNW